MLGGEASETISLASDRGFIPMENGFFLKDKQSESNV